MIDPRQKLTGYGEEAAEALSPSKPSSGKGWPSPAHLAG